MFFTQNNWIALLTMVYKIIQVSKLDGWGVPTQHSNTIDKMYYYLFRNLRTYVVISRCLFLIKTRIQIKYIFGKRGVVYI